MIPPHLLLMKAKIKGLADASSTTGEGLHTKNTTPVHRGYCQKLRRIIGTDTRHNLIAYGLLRNQRYDFIEPRVGSDNLPDPSLILRIILANLPEYAHIDWSLQKVQSLLVNEVVERKKL